MNRRKRLLSLLMTAVMVCSMLPMPALAEGDSVPAMAGTDAAPGAASELSMVTAFAPLEEPAFEVEPGLTEHALGLPETLSATVEGLEEPQTVEGVTWTSEPEYAPETEGVYVFTAVLPEGYEAAEGADLPTVTVTVAEASSSETMAALANVTGDTPAVGTISSDTTWSAGTLSSGTVTVRPGVTLTLNGKLTISGAVTINGGGTIRVGSGFSIAASDNYLIQTSKSSSAQLSLGNITIDGQTSEGNYLNLTALILVDGGNEANTKSTVALGSGTVLQNCHTSATLGAAIHIAGTATMDGAIIQNNTGVAGAGIFVNMNGKFTMTSGTITGNTVTSVGGAGSAITGLGGTITITGGKIEGNRATGGEGGYAGAVVGLGLTISGNPIIWNNTAKTGSGSEHAGNIIVISSINVDAMTPGAQVGVYTKTLPTDSADVKFGALVGSGSAENARTYIHSDQSGAAGVIYCDGTNDTGTGIHESHNSGGAGLYLSTAAKDRQIALTLGSNTTSSGGTLQQSVAPGTAITSIKISPKTYYTLSTDHTLGSGLTYQISGSGESAYATVSGTPTGDVTATLPNATAITRNVNFVLTHLASSNANPHSPSIETDYTVTLSPTTDDYILPKKVTVKVGSGQAEEYDLDSTGKLTIPKNKIIADITVTAEGVLNAWTVNVSKPDNCVGITGNNQTVTKGQALNPNIVITPSSGYELPAPNDSKWDALKAAGTPSLTITKDSSTGAITISGKPNKDIGDSLFSGITATKKSYDVTTGALTNGTLTKPTENGGKAPDGEDYTVTLAPKPGFKLPENAAGIAVTVTVNGVEKTLASTDDFTYDPDTGKIKVLAEEVKGPLNITVDDAAFPVDAKGGVDYADGAGKITVDKPAAGTKYAAVDKNGAPLTGVTAVDGNGDPLHIDGNGWVVPGADGNPATITGPITFKPVALGSEAKVVAAPKASEDTLSDLAGKVPAVSVPVVGNNAYGGVDADPEHAGKTTITIDPADPNMVYSVVNADGSALDPAREWADVGLDGKVVFDNLAPDKAYKVVAKPATGDDSTPAQKAGTGTLVTTPHAETSDPTKNIKDVTAPDVSRADSATNGKDKIVVDSTVTGQEYAVIDKKTGEVVAPVGTGSGSDDDGWQTVNNGSLTFDGLDPNGDYAVVTRTPASGTVGEPGYKDPSLPTKGVDVPHTTVSKDQVKPSAGEDGKAAVIVVESKPGVKYALVDEHGDVVHPMPATGGDADGWLSGTDGDLTFPGLTPGGSYRVVALPEAAGDLDETTGNEYGDGVYPTNVSGVAGPSVKIPTVTESQLSGKVDLGADNKPGGTDDNKDTASITIQPTDPALSYALVDKDGNIVKDGEGNPIWKDGSTSDALTFDGLNPGEKYEVVVTGKNTPANDRPGGADGNTKVPENTGTQITTPKADTKVTGETVTQKVERVNNAPDAQGKVTDKITINPTDGGLDYALIDSATGKLVAPVKDSSGNPVGDGWQAGNNGILTFDGLDPNRKYEIATRPHVTAPDTSIPVMNPTGIEVDKVGVLSASGIVKDANGPVPYVDVKVTVATIDGGYRTVTAKTDGDGKYTLAAEGVKLPGDYTIYVDGKAAGVASSTQTFTKKQPQTLSDIITKKAESGNTNIAGGTLSWYGKPAADRDIVVRDKITGEPVTVPAGFVTSTEDGGGYTVGNLPDGTYIVEVDAVESSGMTEIVVKGGQIVPNTDGGFKNTNIAAAKGHIVTGKVDGLKAGETATVTVNVPVYDVDGATVIGTKALTATAIGNADGTGGYWQIAGVPGAEPSGSKYPVTVITPNGAVTGTVTVDKDGKTTAVSDVTPAAENMKTTSGKLNVKVPEAKPDKPNVITGAVVNAEGKPAVGAAVTIYNEKGEPVGEPLTTGEGGGYTMPALPDGNYYVSADGATGVAGKNGLIGPIKVNGGKTTGKTTVALSKDVGKLLEGNVALEGSTVEKPLPAAGATVVVKDSEGNVIATTKTNADGQYFVGSVPADATVSIVTADGKESGVPTNLGTGSVLNGDAVTAKPAAGSKPVIGPNGDKLGGDDLQMSASTVSGKITVSVKAPNGTTDATGSFEIDASGNLTAKTAPNAPTAGTYTVTVADKNGMAVKSTVTVDAEGKIADNAPITIVPHDVTGAVKYQNGTVPAEAVISVPGWGEAKVNPKTGAYTLTGIPDGSYEAVVKVTDSAKSPAETSEIKVTLKVENGKASYANPDGDDTTKANVDVTEGSTNLAVTPTKSVSTIQTGIANAKTLVAGATGPDATAEKKRDTIAQLEVLQNLMDGLTEEQRKQLDTSALGELSEALTKMLEGELTVKAEAGGVQNAGTATAALAAQQNLLVDASEQRTALDAAKTVDVTLTLKAEDVTNEPTSAVNRDLPKVEKVASQVSAQETALFEIVVEKTTVVKEKPADPSGTAAEISKTTTSVTQLPAPITLTLTIPSDLRGFQYYAVVRVHNGKAERIPSTATASTVTISSSLYSTYAILASNDPMFDDDVKVESGSNNSGSTGGNSGTGSVVNIGKTQGGTISISPKAPGSGDKVTITVKPDEGYTLDQLVIKDSKGNEIKYVDNGDGTYTYTQPGGKVTIDATFRKVTGDPHDNGVDKLLIVDDHIAYMNGDDQGNFRPAGGITRAEVAQMFYNLLKDKNVTSARTFADVSADAWYAKAVTTLAEMGILNGRGNNVFDPEAPITRAEFASIATRFALKTTGTVKFTDVPADHWAYDAIGIAAYYGWINGYEDGTFKPNANIARAEAAKIVNTMLARSGDKSYIDKNADALKLFPDVAKDYWAFDTIVEATNAHGFNIKDGVEVWEK